uniref:Lipase n=1 Tax=bacterium enrichment culture clone F5-11 TaxID=930157 RepID=E5KC17_9BACT|nr:lipase [bacterium enrichment culture clone F5-11]
MKKLLARLAFVASAAVAALAPATASANGPIIFVHGYSGSGSNWDIMASRFVASGYPSNQLYKFDYASLVNSNMVSASQLGSLVNTVRARHGNAKVNIIAHSNGGLVTRWYLVMQNGQSNVRRFISLGSPHSGTTWAYACVSPACFEMRPLSTFLITLAGRGCDRSLWSLVDGIIIPASSAACGQSRLTSQVNHLALLTDAGVYNDVRRELQ